MCYPVQLVARIGENGCCVFACIRWSRATVPGGCREHIGCFLGVCSDVILKRFGRRSHATIRLGAVSVVLSGTYTSFDPCTGYCCSDVLPEPTNPTGVLTPCPCPFHLRNIGMVGMGCASCRFPQPTLNKNGEVSWRIR